MLMQWICVGGVCWFVAEQRELNTELNTEPFLPVYKGMTVLFVWHICKIFPCA